MDPQTQTRILEIQVKYDKALEQIAKYRNEIDRLKKAQKELDDELKKGSITPKEHAVAMEASRQAIRQNNDAIGVLNRQVQNQLKVEKEQQDSLVQLRAKLSLLTREYDELSGAERNAAKGKDLQAKINAITTELKAAEEGTQRFYRNVGNYKSALEGFEKVEGAASKLGRTLLGVFGIMGAGQLFNDIKEVGSSYADQMAKVRAVTNASEEDFKMMSDEVRRLGSTTRYTASEAGEAMENLTRNGLSAAQATGVLEGTLHLAQANVIDLGEAADIVTGQLNSFHLSVNEVNRVNDVLSWTCANSATNITELSRALRPVSPVAYTMGVSIEEVNAALGALADSSLRGADAGQALKQVMMGIASPNAKAQKIMEKYNLTISETMIREQGLDAVLHQVADSGIMQSANAVQELGMLFGKKAGPAAMTLLNSLEKLDEKLVMMGKAEIMSALSNQTEQATETLAKYGVTVEGTNLDAMKMVEVFKKLKENGIMDTKDAFAEMTKIFGKDGVQSAMALMGCLDQFNGTLNDVEGTADRMFGQSFSSFTVATDSLKSAWEGFLITIFESGNGEGVPILNMLTEGLQWAQQNFERFVQIVVALIGSITLTKLIMHVKQSGNTMRQSIMADADAATARVNQLADQEAKKRQQIEALKAQYAKSGAAEQKLIANQLQVAKGQLMDIEKQQHAAKAAQIKATENAAAVATATGWKGAMQTAGIAVKGFVNTAKTALKGFILTAILMTAIELLQKLWSAFNVSGKGIGNLGTKISAFVKGAMKALINAIDAVVNWFIELYNDNILVRASFKALAIAFNTVWSILKAGIRAIGTGFKLLGGIIDGVATALSGLFTLNWDKAVAGVKKLGTAVTDFFKNQWDNVKQTGTEIAEDVGNAFDTMNEKLEPVKITYNEGGGGGGGAGVVDIPGGGGGDDPDRTDGGGGGTGGKGKKDKEAEKAERERKQREKLEMEAMQKLQEELWKLVRDGAEKRRMEVNLQYDKQIAKLRYQLKNEKNLTEEAREDINKTIIALEQQRQEALKKLEFEEIKRVAEEQIKLNEMKLKLVQKGSQEELALKLDNLKRKYDIDKMEAEQALQLEKDKLEQLQNMRNDAHTQRLAAEQAAANEVDEEKKKAYQAEAERLAVEETRLNQALIGQQDAIARANENITLITQNYEREQAVTKEQNWQDEQARLKQHLSTQIQEMENAETERLLKRNGYRALDDEEYEAHMQKQLERIGGFEADKLRMEEDEAQRQYEALVERGRLTTQTQEEYDAELTASKQNWLNKQKAINDAYVKNEEAKQKAVKAVTSGLTALLDQLGEDNKAFAKMSKIITLAQIAIDTGKALSAGIASASSMPFPANIAAIATTVGTILANVATAISTVKSAKFAEGGKVVGPGTGTSDSIPAQLSNGEFVMTARATKIFEPLLIAMNSIGSGVPMQVANSYETISNNESLTDSFSTAAQEIHPIVSVVEITEAQDRVSMIESLDNY